MSHTHTRGADEPRAPRARRRPRTTRARDVEDDARGDEGVRHRARDMHAGRDDDALEAVARCARTGICPRAWRDDDSHGFARDVATVMRTKMLAFGDAYFGARRERGGRATEDGANGARDAAAEDDGAEGRMTAGAAGADEGTSEGQTRDGSTPIKRRKTTGESEVTAPLDEDDEGEIASASTSEAMRRAYEQDVERIASTCVSAHDGDAPFTIQRICELACDPERYYTTPYKLATAMLKLFAVTQTVDRPGGVSVPVASNDEKVIVEKKTKAMERDARDPIAMEQKAFIAAAFQKVTDDAKAVYEDSILPPRPPSPTRVYT